ncbi:MAG: thermonuclease family protein [Nitrospinae bacterium]|nr:thermonuclease family protein [Nitrospinota bacterium]
MLIFRILLILIFTFTLPARGDVYKWIDEDGSVNFTDSIDRIPERYRKGAEKKHLPTTGITLTVRHVIDGDTIIATTGEKVRYLGIDTPELASEKGPAQFFSEDSKKANKELVNGKSMRMEFDAEKIDRHGRLLAYVYLKDGTFINAKLIEDGSARVYFIPPNMKYYDQFKKLEKEAIKRRVGLWSEPDSTTPIPHFDAIKHIGKFRFVEGTVRKVYKTEKAVYLDFGDNPDENFTVTIFNRDYPRFYEKGIDLINYYTGKKIIVYGKVKLYRGAEIIVSFPEDIQLAADLSMQ